MKLNFISTEVLLPFEKDKHFGMFVYLMKDNENYKTGLYIGGINGWERLTNDAQEVIKYVLSPVESTEEYVFITDDDLNGVEQVYYPSNWDKISEYCDIINNRQTDAGDYEVTIKLKENGENLRWFDTDDTSEKVLHWNIKKKSLLIPLWENGTYHTEKYEIMNGDNVEIALNFSNESNDSLKFCYKSDNINYYEVGEYNVNISLIDKDNFMWSDETIADKVLTVSIIEKQSIMQPDDIVITYDGDEHSPEASLGEWWNTNEEFCNIDYIEIEQVPVNAGEYEFKLSLKNKEAFKWVDANGEFSVTDITKKLVICKKILASPTDNSVEYNLNNEYVISPSNWDELKDYCVLSFIPIIPKMDDVSIENKVPIDEEIPIEINNGIVQPIEVPVKIINGNPNTVIGKYDCRVTIKSNKIDNYTFESNNITKLFKFEITPKILALPTDNSAEYNLDKDYTVIPGNWDELKDYCIMSSVSIEQDGSVGDYNCNVSIENLNCKFESGYKIESFVFTITPKFVDIPDWTDVSVEYEFTGEEIKPVPNNWDDIKTYCDISYTPESPKESGTYTCNITLKNYENYENYVWKNGNNGTTFTFTIKVQEAPIYWGYCDSWNDEDEDRQLKNILSNGLIPVDNITTIENEFTISASDFLQQYSGSYLGAWWFAVPINKSVIGGLESDILSWDSTNIDRYTVKYNDIYSNESSEPLVITIEGIDYNVYARKTSGAPSSRNHTLKITIQ